MPFGPTTSLGLNEHKKKREVKGNKEGDCSGRMHALRKEADTVTNNIREIIETEERFYADLYFINARRGNSSEQDSLDCEVFFVNSVNTPFLSALPTLTFLDARSSAYLFLLLRHLRS